MRARITPPLIMPAMLVVAFSVFSCGNSDEVGKSNNEVGNEIDHAGGHEAQAGVTAAAPAAAAPAPYDGPLSPQRMEQAKARVKPFMKWDQAYPALLARVGKPTLVEESKHYWLVQQGDKCHELFVENAGGEVGAVSFGAYDKIMKTQWQRCLRAAGKGEQGVGEQGAGAQGE